MIGCSRTILPGNIGRLKQSGGPRPLTDNNVCSQTSLDHATRRALDSQRIKQGKNSKSKHFSLEQIHVLEVLTGFFSLSTIVLVEEDEKGGEDAKEQAETKNDHVANTFGQRRRSSEVGIYSLEPFERRDFNFSHGCEKDTVSGSQSDAHPKSEKNVS